MPSSGMASSSSAVISFAATLTRSPRDQIRLRLDENDLVALHGEVEALADGVLVADPVVWHVVLGLLLVGPAPGPRAGVRLLVRPPYLPLDHAVLAYDR